MALATMASYKAAITCRGAKSAAEDAWLLPGNQSPIIGPILWKRMYKEIQVYKGRSFAEKVPVLLSQVRTKMQYMMDRGEHLTVNGVSIILAELLGVLLGLRRSEHFGSAEQKPNLTTLLSFRNFSGLTRDLGDMTRRGDIPRWTQQLTPTTEIIKIRL